MNFNHILVVAAREFRQIAGMRSFWLTLLILPIAFGIAPLAQRFMKPDAVERVMIVDRAGGVGSAIERRLRTDQDRDALNKLSRYVQRHKLERADPAAPWSRHDRWYSDAEVAAFSSAGGIQAATAKIDRIRPDGIPDFEPNERRYEFVTPPPAIATAPEANLDEPLQALLDPPGKDAKRVDYVVLIPADFNARPLVKIWANGDAAPRFVTPLQEVLTRDLRSAYLRSHGVSDAVAEQAGTIAPTLAISRPPPGGGAREAMVVRSILPLAAAYLLMMSLMLSGSWMLQGTVEERSGKLLEAVLSCVSPEELMYGKLLGTVGIGLSMIAVWVCCGAVAAYATQGAIADLIRPALAPLTSPGTIAAMIYFFIVGYVAIAVFFLAIGAVSDSMHEAQGFLMPMMLLILLPITLLIQAVVAGGGGVGITVLTWVPIWTPFAVLARLGSGIQAWEVIGSGLLLAAFVAIEMVLLGRLFRASLLATGQRPSLREVIARIRRAA